MGKKSREAEYITSNGLAWVRGHGAPGYGLPRNDIRDVYYDALDPVTVETIFLQYFCPFFCSLVLPTSGQSNHYKEPIYLRQAAFSRR